MVYIIDILPPFHGWHTLIPMLVFGSYKVPFYPKELILEKDILTDS